MRTATLCCAVVLCCNFSQAHGQISVVAHGNVVFVDYKDAYSDETKTTELSLSPVALGVEGRLRVFALTVAAEAYSPPTIDLIMGVRASLTVYPVRLGPIEPFVTANIGSVSGEDIGGTTTTGFGAGVACRLSNRLQLMTQFRRIHFDLSDDVKLENGLSEITIGLKFRIV
ncbi:MAG: hypothetical protein JSW71_21850 [Gemmatimonadota bacterium]|nr:MAG: hypothetical protein JSW71_21850 [Gemmatimonadota bacterium]